MQTCSNVTKVWVELKSCDLGHRKNDTFTLSAMPPTNYVCVISFKQIIVDLLAKKYLK